MKLSPAIQLVMKAAANATARRALKLNPPANGEEIKNKITIKIKRNAASSNPT
jgi:hypothetical protein